MAIVAGFDVHRAQITFDALDRDTGEVRRGRIRATPEAVREWAGWFLGEEIHVAVEACTGWLFVCAALAEAGAVAHLAEPVETSALRGKKRRAKTDREDGRWLRELLCEGRLPEAWIPPAHVLEWRTRTRLRKTLVDERTRWLQRVQATLFHYGISGAPDRLLSTQGRVFLAGVAPPAAARERIEVALAMIEALDCQLAPIEQTLRRLAAASPDAAR
jgi:transposase